MRSKNIILYGVPEPVSKSLEDRQGRDKSMVVNILNIILADCPAPIKMFRLGKYNANKNRLIKVCFSSEEIVKRLLKIKQNNKEDEIRVFSDQTPQQKAYLKALKVELERRICDGETNLIIKYIKGLPKIIKAIPKNFNL